MLEKLGYALFNFKKNVVAYRAKHVKIKDFTFKGWVHNAVQVAVAAMGADLCAAHVVAIQNFAVLHDLNVLSNVFYYYFSFGFVGVLLISFFGLWDMYVFGRQMTVNIHEGVKL